MRLDLSTSDQLILGDNCYYESAPHQTCGIDSNLVDQGFDSNIIGFNCRSYGKGAERAMGQGWMDSKGNIWGILVE